MEKNATIGALKSSLGKPAVKFTSWSQVSLAFSNIVKMPLGKRRGTNHSVGVELFQLPVLID